MIIENSIQFIVMIIALIAFWYQQNKDKKEQNERNIQRDERIESRLQLLERENSRHIELTTLFHSTLDRYENKLNEIKIELELLKDLKLSMKELNDTIKGISRHTAEHGIEIKNLKEKCK